MLGKCAVTGKYSTSFSGITQVNLTLIDACSSASVFFYIMQNIISHLREHTARCKLPFQITEASQGLNFMRESQSLKIWFWNLKLILLVNGYPSGCVSWPICALNERKFRPSLLFIWVWITQHWIRLINGLSTEQLDPFPPPPGKAGCGQWTETY